MLNGAFPRVAIVGFKLLFMIKGGIIMNGIGIQFLGLFQLFGVMDLFFQIVALKI